MATFPRLFCVFSITLLLAINSTAELYPPLRIDQMISDYFEIEKNLWILVESSAGNVTKQINDAIKDIQLDSSDEFPMRYKIEGIEYQESGKRMYEILRDIAFYYKDIVRPEKVESSINKTRGVIEEMRNITTRNEYWNAAYERAVTVWNFNFLLKFKKHIL